MIRKGDKVLLGIKKRGFGVGKWNGFGGKVKEGETIEFATKRETKEEAGVDVGAMKKFGVLEFEFQGNPEIWEVHLFSVNEFLGEPIETEEMRPEWFHVNEIPLQNMWADDQYWFPLFLKGKRFKGKFLFRDEETILEHQLQEVDIL